MFLFERIIARRYALPGLTRGMSGLLSLISLSGLSLSVFGLVLVMSVMNGFERELQNRMLALLPHAKLSFLNTDDSTLTTIAGELEKHPSVVSAEPYIEGRVLLRNARHTIPIDLVALDFGGGYTQSKIRGSVVSGDIDELNSQPFAIAIGIQLARKLNIGIGDSITVVIPRVYINPLGPVVRERNLVVAAILEVGAEIDMSLGIMTSLYAKKLLARKGFDGLRIETEDQYQIDTIAEQATRMAGVSLASDSPANDAVKKQTKTAALPKGMPTASLTTWKQENAALYAAVVMEKLMIFVLLLSIVAVASFSIVAIVLMNVLDKQTQIAILRTMGASKPQIRRAFLLQGLFIGFVGTLFGAALAVLVAPNLGATLQWMESVFGWQLFDPNVYYIAYLPTLLKISDVLVVCTIAIFISVIVSVFPAGRAAEIDPVISLAAVN